VLTIGIDENPSLAKQRKRSDRSCRLKLRLVKGAGKALLANLVTLDLERQPTGQLRVSAGRALGTLGTIAALDIPAMQANDIRCFARRFPLFYCLCRFLLRSELALQPIAKGQRERNRDANPHDEQEQDDRGF
jgi:hypothetical protein